MTTNRSCSTARGGKVDFLRGFWKSNPNFEAVQIDDVATSDFGDALEGKHVIAYSFTLRIRIDTERRLLSMLQMSKPSSTSHSHSQTTRIRQRRSRFDVICTALATTLTHNCTIIIQGAIDGAMNVLRQGAAKGIKKFVLTSSWVTVLDRESRRFDFPEWRTVVNGRMQPH